VILQGFLEINSLHKSRKIFASQAENDRKEVAAAITPLWVIGGDNIGVAGVRESGGRQKAAFLFWERRPILRHSR
jgi:hypothetical protein